MSGQLLCGASKVKITPSEELLPFQFGLIGQQYGRVHDDLFLRVVALESNGRRALIVVYDLDKAPYPAEWLPWLAEQTGVEENYIFYTAIHTHTAPLTGYRPFEGPNFIEQKPPQVQEKVHLYEAFLKDSLLRAAREALGNLAPARMGFATGECRLGVNRCQEYVVRTSSSEELSELNIGVNLEERPDPTLLVVRFENAENRKTIALLTNYAVHCVAAFQNTCDDGKAFLSADIGGAVSVQLEKQYPGCVALWTSAGCKSGNYGAELCPQPGDRRSGNHLYFRRSCCGCNFADSISAPTGCHCADDALCTLQYREGSCFGENRVGGNPMRTRRLWRGKPQVEGL